MPAMPAAPGGVRGLWSTAAFAALVLSCAPHAGASFARLDSGAKCFDYLVPEVASKDDCFNAAASALGLGGAQKVQINGIGFTGCAFNTVANLLIFSESHSAIPSTHVSLPSLQYICNGIPTTTITSTVTTTTTSGVFAKLGPNSRCADEGVPEVLSKELCFDMAGSVVGIANFAKKELNNMGFSGCVYNSGAQLLVYGVTPGVAAEENMKLPTFEYICNGIPTTTTTSTTTATTQTVTLTTSTTTTKVYARLAAGQKCGDFQMPAVTSKEACFGRAAALAGLAGMAQAEVNFMGFTGCVFNDVAGLLMYGVTPGVSPEQSLALSHFVYLCEGHAPPLYP